MDRATMFSLVRTSEAEYVSALMEDLHSLWGALWAETERKQLHLDSMYQAQQYYSDIVEVEAWLSEQELHMMNEEKGKVEQERRTDTHYIHFINSAQICLYALQKSDIYILIVIIFLTLHVKWNFSYKLCTCSGSLIKNDCVT